MKSLTDHWSNLPLNNMEGVDLQLLEERSTKEFTIAAKFLTKQALNIDAIIRTFSPLWQSINSFEVRKAGDHVLLFVFDNKEEVEKILTNEPWSFDKHLVVLQWYKKDTLVQDLKFDKVSVWVQVHDTPIRFMNRGVMEELCEFIGKVWKETRDSEIVGGSFMCV